ncbi:MAG: trypsin-like peptidase domain-containing protein [Chloroflexi bacterium]|nr:trypsin-like peptidase domain-containing protein [Chloroflexota bacterium]
MTLQTHSLSWLLRFLIVLAGLVSTGVAGGLTVHYAGYGSSPRPTPSSTPIEAGFVNAVRRVEPAVVTIINQQQARVDDMEVSTSLVHGSGIIFDARGYILTNNHVVTLAERIHVIFANRRKVQAMVIGGDSLSDVAVIQVDGPVPAVASFANSSALELGQMVIAIGNPYQDYGGSVTLGVVSGLNRRVGGIQGLIQTDAAINPGSSGGPLVTIRGEVVGINNFVLRSTGEGRTLEGMGFAIPSNQALEAAHKLLSIQEVHHGK